MDTPLAPGRRIFIISHPIPAAISFTVFLLVILGHPTVEPKGPFEFILPHAVGTDFQSVESRETNQKNFGNIPDQIADQMNFQRTLNDVQTYVAELEERAMPFLRNYFTCVDWS
ncbi:hypothetical protein PQX77_002635 [Marasmius sp. AFHP31]|nr:hypothetical protein PQX77_002635 [Marasmius sp. AFHP31]